MPGKKEKIILIAKDVIHSKGFQATSINDILEAANIGKGQFYHYFSSKYELGLAVVDYLIQTWNQQLIQGILKSDEDPSTKLDKMLEWAVHSHEQMPIKHGCPIGNLAIEMSQHDEEFRRRIQRFFDDWIQGIEDTLNEMVEKGQLNSDRNNKKWAQSIVAMIEGAILLMKNKNDIQVLKNIVDIIRIQLNLSSFR